MYVCVYVYTFKCTYLCICKHINRLICTYILVMVN